MGVKEHFIISQTKHMLWILKKTTSMSNKKYFIDSQTKHVLWILKRTVSVRRFYLSIQTACFLNKSIITMNPNDVYGIYKTYKVFYYLVSWVMFQM